MGEKNGRSDGVVVISAATRNPRQSFFRAVHGVVVPASSSLPSSSLPLLLPSRLCRPWLFSVLELVFLVLDPSSSLSPHNCLLVSLFLSFCLILQKLYRVRQSCLRAAGY